MKLKLLFEDNKTYLATEQGDIIENIEIVKSNISYEVTLIDANSETALVKRQFILEIKFDGVVEITSPLYVEGTIIKVPQQKLLEAKKSRG